MMPDTLSKELIIVGGGPAGLKAGEEAAKHDIDYLILEQGQVAQAWSEIRPDMKFLSPCHPQRDWTSLSSRFPIWKLDVDRPYCTAEQFVHYLHAFSDRFKLNIKTQCAVSDVDHDGDVFVVTDASGNTYTAPIVLMTSGIFGNPFIPAIPGVENNPHIMHSHYYMSARDFQKQSVLIVGAGNSAAETAIDLCGSAMVYMVSREDLQYFSDTKKLYHIRGISESYLKELISMEIIRYRAFQDIRAIEENTVLFKDWKLKVDRIIFATGYHAHISMLKKFKLRVNKNNYPEVSLAGESLQYPNLFFGGPLALHSAASLVIHGFVKNVPPTVERIAQKLKGEIPLQM